MSKQAGESDRSASGARRPGWSKSVRMEARRAETRHHGARFTTAAPGGVRPTTGNAQITEQLVDQMTEALRPARKDRMSCAMPPGRQTTPWHG